MFSVIYFGTLRHIHIILFTLRHAFEPKVFNFEEYSRKFSLADRVLCGSETVEKKLDQSEIKWVKCRTFGGITVAAGLYNQPDSVTFLAGTHTPDHGHKWRKGRKRARAE